MSESRNRLLATAEHLFYTRGLPNVGINEVTDKADVARMTLYNHFGSKEALARAAFEALSLKRIASLEHALEKNKTTELQIASLFDLAQQIALDADFRGCAFINVAVQIPESSGKLHEISKAHKKRILSLIQGMLSELPEASRNLLAQQVLLLWDGGIVEAYIQDSTAPIHAAKSAALTLLSYHCSKSVRAKPNVTKQTSAE